MSPAKVLFVDFFLTSHIAMNQSQIKIIMFVFERDANWARMKSQLGDPYYLPVLLSDVSN
jgi:hypothetical protein